MTIIRTCIVEQNDLIREGIKSFISGKNYKISGEFKNIENLDLDIETDFPQLIIIGINIRVISTYNGQEEITNLKLHLKRIRKTFPAVHLIMLVSHEALIHIPDLYSWDVDGYICRDITKCGFLNYLNLAMIGEKIIPVPLLHAQINGNYHAYTGMDTPQHPHNTNSNPVFSTRENEILRCIALGSPNKQIASDLSITESTVKVHLKTILRKLGVNNRTQAALWAIKNGVYGAAESMLLIYIYNLEPFSVLY